MSRDDALIALAGAILSNPALNPITLNPGDVVFKARQIVDRLLTPPAEFEPAPQPAPREPGCDDEPARPKRLAPRTGRELYDYAVSCKTDPSLKGWINQTWAAWPHWIPKWSDAQVQAAWPEIRAHLLELKAARNGSPVNGVPV